ncbi:glycoside hydrolase family 35 protein [Paucibacter soli]|uniref:glycoside hydrolase family 35 protein n=1 Tax=Paucibacter soli TaxID=3133433 RepID=UPI0030AE98F6
MLHLSRRSALMAMLLGNGLPAVAALGKSRFAIQGARFTLDGAPFQIRSGELHYPRIPHPLWRERLRMAKAMGLNTITTYAFWSQHEPEPGQWDFSGQRDIAAFIRCAAAEGLQVILRPGPYVCAEVDFGGLPAWLLRTPGLRVRSLDPRFMAASARYMKRLAREVGALQSTRGGPLLMLQLENEYGSYGRDRDYLRAMQRQLREAGFDAPLFTSDGGTERLFAGGTLPDVPAVVNFGGGVEDASASIEALRAWRPQGVRMVGEYWAGWFDHWGEPHHTQSAEEAAATVDWMMREGISFNLYMFHGGSSFGWLPGANYSATEPYQPDTTSYDYDAALDESGRITPKYLALRAAMARHLPRGQVLPPVPPQSATIEIPAFELRRSAALLEALPALSPKAIAARYPQPMESYGQSYGYILYRKRLQAPGMGRLAIKEVRDHALVLADGRPLGTLDRRKGEQALDVDLPAGTQLDILVENMGRIGFGARLDGEHKGITHGVTLGEQELLDWQVHPLPLQDLSALPWHGAGHAGPGFWQGEFTLTQTGDSFLDTRGWGKGQVWVNGQHLGRFWNIGPQQTLYLPGVWLKPGRNEVLLFSLEAPAMAATLRGLERPLFDTPTAPP